MFNIFWNILLFYACKWVLVAPNSMKNLFPLQCFCNVPIMFLQCSYNILMILQCFYKNRLSLHASASTRHRWIQTHIRNNKATCFCNFPNGKIVEQFSKCLSYYSLIFAVCVAFIVRFVCDKKFNRNTTKHGLPRRREMMCLKSGYALNFNFHKD